MDPEEIARACRALRWESRYRKRSEVPEGARWFLPDLPCLDADFQAALRALDVRAGTVLDIGTGLGTQALHWAQHGFTVTATDVSATAIRLAREKAQDAQRDVRFLEDDILSTRLSGRFDIVADRGCFTLLRAKDREDYARNVSHLLGSGGFLFLKVDGARDWDKLRAPLEQFLIVLSKANTTYGAGAHPGREAQFSVLAKRCSAGGLGA